ncbi:MAG: family 2B encapsulin nanocompartment shell protein [Pseudonocardia sp.]
MTVTDLHRDPGPESAQSSLDTAAARNLATTTKSVPQMRGISPRWLLRKLPWVAVDSGTYRVNRRLTYLTGDGRVTFVQTGSSVQVVPAELGELSALRSFTDGAILAALADRFEQRQVEPGEVLAELGRPVHEIILVAHGKISKIGTGPYGDPTVLGLLTDGDHVGGQMLTDPRSTWGCTVKAVTPCVILALSRAAFDALLGSAPALRTYLDGSAAEPGPARNKYGEAPVDIAAGHEGEPVLPSTFVDYDPVPRDYGLSVAQTVLRVHTRVADLYNSPMDQTEQQLRLTIEELRERQEHELVNNPDFGLLANAAFSQRIQTRDGPPTPADLDELLSRRRRTELFLAHPRTIAAFHRECTSRGLYPEVVQVDGRPQAAWRAVPILPCNKIPISAHGTSSVLAMRTGEEASGVVGLRPTAVPDEYEPGLNVRFTGIDERAVLSYLVSDYYSAAVLVPDALGVLENVELGR